MSCLLFCPKPTCSEDSAIQLHILRSYNAFVQEICMHAVCMQMAYNTEQRRLQERERRREAQAGADAEAAYQARIRNAAEVEAPSYFGRPKVQWFY
jgi:hypothetical protein